jgi:hypothetical protein
MRDALELFWDIGQVHSRNFNWVPFIPSDQLIRSFNTAHLIVQFWDLYCICNEKTKTIDEVGVNRELRLSFKRELFYLT